MGEEEEGRGGGVLYRYKGEVAIPILGLMDDMWAVTEEGVNANIMNAYINFHSANKGYQFSNSKCKTLRMGKKTQMFQTKPLEVDSWKYTYDVDGNISEKYDGKLPMQEVNSIKYLGFIISGDGSNSENISSKAIRSINTTRKIMNMIQGLASHTFECGLIYFKSLHRGSALYASETYYNLSELDLRNIESPEQDCLKQIANSSKICPKFLLFLEFGEIPGRFHIYKMKLHFLHQILTQKENSLMFRFFEAQRKNPTKGDWVSGINEALQICEINLTFSEIKHMKLSNYEGIVNKNIKICAFNYLKSQIRSKGSEIDYGEFLTLQDYLRPNDILTLAEQRALFSYRVRANELQYNTPGSGEKEFCICQEHLTNDHLYSCPVLNDTYTQEVPQYDAIFNGTLKQKKVIINILTKNMNKIKKAKEPPGTSD